MIEALIIGSIATWRIVHMIQEETGPWALFDRLRWSVSKMKHTDGGLAEGFFCFKCMSVWVAILLGVLYFTLSTVFWIVTIPLAISALAIFINDWNTKNV